MTDTPLELIARLERMKNLRSTLENHWEDLRQHYHPQGTPITGSQTPGQKSHANVLDPTGIITLRNLVAAFVGLTTNSATRWFSQTTADREPTDEEALWLEFVRDQMLSVFASPRSGFTLNRLKKMREKCLYGTGCMFIADRPGEIPLFSTRPMKEMYIDENFEGKIDTNFRFFKMSARQAVQQWGNDAGEKVVKCALDPKKSDEEFEFLHATYPRKDRDQYKKNGANKPVASCWVNVSEKKLIREDGYDESPYITSRWDNEAGEKYGRSPAMETLPAVKMLQRVAKATIQGAEKTVNPPLLIADDGVLSPVLLTSGGLNTVRADLMSGQGQGPIRPLISGARPDIGKEFAAGIQQQVREGMLEQLFVYARDPRMTATQVVEIRGQVQSQVEPLLGYEQTEDLGPTIDRTFGIMFRSGMLFDFDRWPEAGWPVSLSGRELKVEYQSPIFKARNIDEVRAMVQSIESWAFILKEDQSLLDNVDLDDGFRRTWTILGAPRTSLRPIDQRDAMRKAKQDEAAKQVQMQQMEQGANAAGQIMRSMPAMKEAMQPAEAAQ